MKIDRKGIKNMKGVYLNTRQEESTVKTNYLSKLVGFMAFMVLSIFVMSISYGNVYASSISSIITSRGTLNIGDVELDHRGLATEDWSAIKATSGTVNITDGDLKTTFIGESEYTGTGKTIDVDENANVTVNGGVITSSIGNAINNNGSNPVTLGNLVDGIVSTISPVIKGQTYGIIGNIKFYDGIVSGKTNAFLDRNSVVDKPEGHYVRIKRQGEYENAIVAKVYKINFFPNVLPAEYMQVDYIESTGTQYIDTGFASTSGMKVQMGAAYTVQPTGSIVWYLVGAHNPTTPFGRNGAGWYYDNVWELGFGENDPRIAYNDSVVNKKYDIEFSTISGNGYLIVDGNEIITTSESQTTTDRNVLIFYEQYSQVQDLATTKAKLYYANIYNSSGQLVREFTPCYRTSDGEVGLWDSVTRTFYTNAGEGKFVRGPLVENAQDIFVNETENLDTNQFEFNGYTFKNWDTIPAGTGTSYEDEEQVINLTTIPGGMVNLYAQWEGNYSIEGATGTRYTTLVAAYNNLPGAVGSKTGTIIVERDNTDSSTFKVASGDIITLDTNENTITKTTAEIINNGILNICGDGTIQTGNPESENLEYIIYVDKGGQLTVDEATLIHKGRKSGFWHVIYGTGQGSEAGTIIINSGNLYAMEPTGVSHANTGQTIVLLYDANLYVNGGTISTNALAGTAATTIDDHAIPIKATANIGSGVIDISGGLIEQATDAYAHGILIEGWGTEQCKELIMSGGTIKTSGIGISIKPSAKSNVTITGGKILSGSQGILNNGGGVTTLGIKGDGIVSTTSPEIYGLGRGMSGKYKFYDGIVFSKSDAINDENTNTGFNGNLVTTMLDIEDGYEVLTEQSGDYETATLKAKTYTVEYYQGSTKLGTSTHNVDTAQNLTAYNTIRGSTTAPSGWSFYGWATSSSATSRTYTDEQSVTNLTSGGGTVKLYAVFKNGD